MAITGGKRFLMGMILPGHLYVLLAEHDEDEEEQADEEDAEDGKCRYGCNTGVQLSGWKEMGCV